MRISDWSSDVCSSDLLREQYELSIRAVAAFECFKAVCDARLGVAGPSLNTLQEALKRIVQIRAKAARAKGLIGAEEAAEALGEEIGRHVWNPGNNAQLVCHCSLGKKNHYA